MMVDNSTWYIVIATEVERSYISYPHLCYCYVGEENEEEEEEEEEGSSNYEEDGIEFYEDAGEGGVFRMFPSSERDGGNVVMIQHNIENQDIANTSTPVNTRPSLPWNTTFPLPLGLFEEPPAGSENNGK